MDNNSTEHPAKLLLIPPPEESTENLSPSNPTPATSTVTEHSTPTTPAPSALPETTQPASQSDETQELFSATPSPTPQQQMEKVAGPRPGTAHPTAQAV